MDTGSKRFNFTAVRKFIALILCFVSVAVIVNQTISSLARAEEEDLGRNSVRDALSYNSAEEEIWETNSFKASFGGYIDALSSAVGKYGDGSEEAYKTKTEYINSYNKYVKKEAKKNLVRYLQAKNVCYEYLVAEYDGVVKTVDQVGTLDLSDETKYNYYDEVLEDDSLDYDYVAHGNFDRDSLTIYTEIKEAAEKLGADGVVKLDYKCVIISSDIYTDEDVTYKVYEPGYYAFKVDTENFYEWLTKEGVLIENDVINYEIFKSDHANALKEIEKYYDTGRYYIKDSKGRVYTNMASLSADSSKAEIAVAFEKLGFYCYQSDNLEMCLPDGRGYTWHILSDQSNEENYYSVNIETSDVNHTSQSLDVSESVTSDAANTVYDTTIYETTVIDDSTSVVTVKKGTNKSTIPYYDNTPFVSSGDIICYIGVDMTAEPASDDNAFVAAEVNIEEARAIIKGFAITFIILALQFIICFIWLIYKSGRRKYGDEKVYLFKADKIFSEIRIAFDVAAATFLGACIYELLGNYEFTSLYRALLIAACTCFTAIVLDFTLFIARHIKNKTFLSNFFVVWIVKKSAGKIKKIADNLKEKLYYVSDVRKPVFIKTGIVVALNVIIGFIALMCSAAEAEITLIFVASLFLFDLFVIYRGLVFVGGVHKLFKVIGELRKGNLEEEIKKEALPSYLVPHAENLQSLGEGLKVAVEEAVRQEQTKTELITNVSHDLKTPLTSIINYVDLLKKCDITDETALSYLQVLSEKSDRLKYLISDLVEASKASTGALPVNLVDMSLQELLKQLIGEFEEDFEKRGLKIIFDTDVNDVLVKADCKHLYRVMENLFVNVKKYALKNSRVYVSIGAEGNKGIVTVKNISAEPLNIAASELKNRFVRGDQSRTTEGNGLGLSIAENLCTLQGGNLVLEINGDLFVAKVEMNRA